MTDNTTPVFESFTAKIASKVRAKYLPLLASTVKKETFLASNAAYLEAISKKHKIDINDKAFADFWSELTVAAAVIAENGGRTTNMKSRIFNYSVLAFAGIGAGVAVYTGYRFFAGGGRVVEVVEAAAEAAA